MNPMKGIVEASAEVLQAESPEAARARLAETLRRSSGGEVVSRVQLAGAAATFFIDRDAPAPSDLPTAADLRLHPLLRFHERFGSGPPVLMEDAVTSGFELRKATMSVIERLGLSVNQLSVPTAPASAAASYTGWVAISSERIDRRAVELISLFQPLITALDRHVEALESVTLTDDCPLTPRERVVLGLLADGLTARAMATRLAVSERTVHKHLEHLYRKLGATDRLSAVLCAQGRGWLPRPSGTDQASPAAHSSRYPSSVTVSSPKSSSSR